jgi:hypothetical protein
MPEQLCLAVSREAGSIGFRRKGKRPATAPLQKGNPEERSQEEAIVP